MNDERCEAEYSNKDGVLQIRRLVEAKSLDEEVAINSREKQHRR